ncbi:MAG: hypothetical protein FRX49_09093 [Trebouxia sp. A1-2]|nr:MAG: hypothetical protein FRX49_09093 [Trebouxia sp. A1-2]
MGPASSPVLVAASTVWLRLVAGAGAGEEGSADVAACSCASDGLTMRCQTPNIDFSWLKGSGTWTSIALAILTYWLNTLRDNYTSSQEVTGLPKLKGTHKRTSIALFYYVSFDGLIPQSYPLLDHRKLTRYCGNRRCKAFRAKAEADTQSAAADIPSSQSDANPDDKAAATTAAADSSQQTQLEAALTPQQPPESGRDATPVPADPAALARSVHAASRGNARTEGTMPGASDRPRSTTHKRHQDEECDTEQLPMRPMPARIQQSRAPSGYASQQADKQIAAVVQPATPGPIDFPTGSASPAELSSDRAFLAAQSSDRLSPAAKKCSQAARGGNETLFNAMGGEAQILLSLTSLKFWWQKKVTS